MSELGRPRTGEIASWVPRGIWLAGAEVDTDEHLDVLDPASGDAVGSVSLAGSSQAYAAVEASAAVATQWASTAPRQRGEILRRAYELLVQRAESIAAVITSEMGKPLREARTEVLVAADYFRWASEDAARIAGSILTSPNGGAEIQVRRRPVGLCYLVTPWNFPLSMAARKVAPAIAAGCTAILKPSELTPFSALALAAVLRDAGVPDGVLSVLVSDRPELISEVLMADPRVRKVSFTGSTRVGTMLMRQAADNVLRSSMELGGNAPLVVAQGADLDAMLDDIVSAKMRNAGQTCVTPNRFYVHGSLADRFSAEVVERLAALRQGPGNDEGTDVGPLASLAQRQRVHELVRGAVDGGARLLLGGEIPSGPGSFYPPTVLTDVPTECPLAHEEIFGPVVAIQRYDDESEMIERANSTQAGLGAYVFDADLGRASAIAHQLEVGMVAVNLGVISDVATPFGGVKASGVGREGGLGGIDEYLEVRAIRTASEW